MLLARVLPILVGLTSFSVAALGAQPRNSFDILLHSSSLSEQRAALTTILATPERYLAQIRRGLQTYPRTLEKDPVAANRTVYVAASIRDRSFIPILRGLLGNPHVLDECLYACAPVFALSVYANFAGWRIPADLDSHLTTVTDLRSSLEWVSRLTLEKRPLEDVTEGPWIQEHKHEIEDKTEEELIDMAGPANASNEGRWLAAAALEVSVSQSRNRKDLYLLAMNDIRDDASREYLNAIHVAMYRAELARVRGR